MLWLLVAGREHRGMRASWVAGMASWIASVVGCGLVGHKHRGSPHALDSGHGSWPVCLSWFGHGSWVDWFGRGLWVATEIGLRFVGCG